MNDIHPATRQHQQSKKMRKVSDDDRRAMTLLNMCVNELRGDGLDDRKIGRVLYALRHHCRIVAESVRDGGGL